MNPLLTEGAKALNSFLRRRTGFFGFGPSNGEIIVTALIAWAAQRAGEKSVVREAEKILTEINERNARLL